MIGVTQGVGIDACHLPLSSLTPVILSAADRFACEAVCEVEGPCACLPPRSGPGEFSRCSTFLITVTGSARRLGGGVTPFGYSQNFGWRLGFQLALSK